MRMELVFPHRGRHLRVYRFRSHAELGVAPAPREGQAMDEELISEQVQVERKLFSFSLKQNLRGRFMKITEDVGGRRDTVIIPSTGLLQIREAIDHMIEADTKFGPPPATQV